jgi:hypothetical protein
MRLKRGLGGCDAVDGTSVDALWMDVEGGWVGPRDTGMEDGKAGV